ncbi:MAG TPA: DUF1302 domain-containing protein, partial [Nevskiaceae bacterium]|nr:DUF1302 domain-containing protein [Nevskiaceae bacterium]
MRFKSVPLSGAAVLLALCAPQAAHATSIDVGNPDLSLRWDNTVRYNLGVRVESRDEQIGNTAIADEGTWSFDNGDVVTNRLDLLSELDVVYKNDYGVRFSGAAWYDEAYDDRSHGNPNAPLSAIPSYVGNEYSHHTERFYRGFSGELLDAFAFAKFNLGDVRVAAKAGRHAVFWGESILLNGVVHSVGYSQVPLDLQKGIATPGVEAKELFRPLASLSAQSQVTGTLSLAGQYFLEWDSFRYPEGGTYLGPVDFLFDGPDRQFLNPTLGFAARGRAVEPKERGDWGLSVRWSPKALPGSFGVYYRNFSDKLPQVLITQVGPGVTRYNNIYADDIDLWGLSYTQQVLGASVSGEFSYRRNMPLTAQVLGISPNGLPPDGETSGPRGDTLHAVINAIGVINRTPVFDAANWIVETTWSQYTKIRSGEALFNGLGHAPCVGRDKWDGCATRNYVGLGLSFSPTWYQVFPSIDFYAPVTFSRGLYGNAATTLGGNQGNGNYSVGLGVDVRQKYRFDLKYIDYLGHYRDNGTAVTTQNGFTTLLK